MTQVNDFIPDDAPPRVTAATVADWLGVTPQTVYNWANTGQLPRPIRLGPRKYLWETAAVRESLRRQLAAAHEGRGGE